MGRKVSRIAATLAAVATFSIAATPALARDRWGGGDWGRHYRHDRVDAGDIFAGVLIIGAIAAIASASSKTAIGLGFALGQRADYAFPHTSPRTKAGVWFAQYKGPAGAQAPAA